MAQSPAWSVLNPVSDDDPITFAENSTVQVASNGTVYSSFMHYDPELKRYFLRLDRSTDGVTCRGPTAASAAPTCSRPVRGSSAERGGARCSMASSAPFRSRGWRPTQRIRTECSWSTRHRSRVAPAGRLLPAIHARRPGLDGANCPGGNKNDQFLPAIAASPTGNVLAAWYDRRNDSANQKTDVYGAYSRTHGVSFDPFFRVTNTAFKTPMLNPPWDTFRATCGSGYRIDLVFAGATAQAIWTDGRDAGPAANNGVDRTSTRSRSGSPRSRRWPRFAVPRRGLPAAR